jgi:hypothetical protein
MKGKMLAPTRIKFYLLAALALGAMAVRAQNLSGSYSNDCGGLVKLWDLSGSYAENNGIETESFTIAMDASGNVTGTGHFNLSDDTYAVYLDSDLAVSGKVSSAGTVTRLKLSLTTVNGTGTVGGYNVTFVVTEKENFEVDSFDRMLTGKGTGRLKVIRVDDGKTISHAIPAGYVGTSMPDEADGEWGLSLNPTVTDTKYGGDGAITLSNGKIFDLGLTGAFSTKTGLSKIALKSTDSAHPMTLTLTGTSDSQNLDIKSLKGKLLGQSLQYSP